MLQLTLAQTVPISDQKRILAVLGLFFQTMPNPNEACCAASNRLSHAKEAALGPSQHDYFPLPINLPAAALNGLYFIIVVA